MQGKIGEIPLPRKPSIDGLVLEDLAPPQLCELRRKAGRAATHPITRHQEEDLKETPRSPRSSIYTCFAPEDRGPIASKDAKSRKGLPGRIKHVISQRRGLDRSSSPMTRQSSPQSPGLHLRHFTGKGDASNLMFTGSSFL
mmetsp:Transcript_12695/g.17908  ORF Transcript_12695/g.17908 Transcript_12695/m.17908 type:complete len:141 (+) Transcript_12695:43-465(+)